MAVDLGKAEDFIWQHARVLVLGSSACCGSVQSIRGSRSGRPMPSHKGQRSRHESHVQVDDLLGSGEIVPLDPDAESGSGTHSPLQVVRSQDHPLRSALKEEVVEMFLDRLEKEQQEDARRLLFFETTSCFSWPRGAGGDPKSLRTPWARKARAGWPPW